MIDEGADREQLEPAIPEHLRVERTHPLNAPKDFVPKHPSYSARFRPEISRLTIAYYGVQSARSNPERKRALSKITTAFASSYGPLFWDQANYIDGQGCRNDVLAAYWNDDATFKRWDGALGDGWWYDSLSATGSIGAFREILRPSVWDVETTFSHPHPEGLGMIAHAMSGNTDTHEYWGSARDRIPRAQTDLLAARGRPNTPSAVGNADTFGHLVAVCPHENLCLLRSGQDWSETEGTEREFYLTQVKPYLDVGMEELVTQGLNLGCYFNRYVLIEDGSNNERSYSMSAWDSLAALEDWVKADTHLKIWAAGIKHYKRVGDAARLRLYHELTVLKAKDQSFAYFNCHPRTGMLAAAGSSNLAPD